MVIYPFLGRIWCRYARKMWSKAYTIDVCVPNSPFPPLSTYPLKPNKTTTTINLYHSVCPFMIYGEWAQETLKKVLPDVKLRKWPQSITNGYVLFSGLVYTSLCVCAVWWAVAGTAGYMVHAHLKHIPNHKQIQTTGGVPGSCMGCSPPFSTGRRYVRLFVCM